MSDSTIVIIKPHCIREGHIGTIIDTFEQNNLHVDNMRMLMASDELIRRHYEKHEGQSYFWELVQCMTEGPLVAVVIVGVDALQKVRQLVGSTDPAQAPHGTIRHQLGSSKVYNAVHASKTPTDARRENWLWFRFLQ